MKYLFIDTWKKQHKEETKTTHEKQLYVYTGASSFSWHAEVRPFVPWNFQDVLSSHLDWLDLEESHNTKWRNKMFCTTQKHLIAIVFGRRVACFAGSRLYDDRVLFFRLFLALFPDLTTGLSSVMSSWLGWSFGFLSSSTSPSSCLSL